MLAVVLFASLCKLSLQMVKKKNLPDEFKAGLPLFQFQLARRYAISQRLTIAFITRKRPYGVISQAYVSHPSLNMFINKSKRSVPMCHNNKKTVFFQCQNNQ